MKKLFRTMLCAAVLTAAISIPAFAAEADVLTVSPAAVKGDFSVLVNGKDVTFTDAVPKIRDSRSCLPFVAVFEQLGFAEQDMTWDAATKTVTASKEGTTVSLTIGQKQITLTRDGKTSVIDTDVAPYIEPSLSRTYIPFGLVADALEYNVGWDADTRTVLIDDVDAILAANSETYKVMDQFMAYNKTFAEKNQKVTGSYAMGMDLNVSDGTGDSVVNLKADGDYEMLMANSSAFQFETDMTMDMKMSLNGEDITGAMNGEGMPAFPISIDYDMRGDLADGMFYFQSEALAKLMEQPDLANAWFKLDLASMFDQMSAALGMNYADLMALNTASLDMSFEESLAAVLKAMPLSSSKATASDSLAALNALVGDSAFEKSGSKYISTMEQDGAKVTLTLYTSGSKITGYAMDMTAADPAFGEMKMTASMKDSKMNLSIDMDVSMAQEEAASTAMSISMEIDGTYRSTSAKPETEPPAKAVIIDLEELTPQSAPALPVSGI